MDKKTDMRDKTLKCQDCGEDFTFEAGEQDFFAKMGYADPKRCRLCRQKRKHEKQKLLRQQKQNEKART